MRKNTGCFDWVFFYNSALLQKFFSIQKVFPQSTWDVLWCLGYFILQSPFSLISFIRRELQKYQKVRHFVNLRIIWISLWISLHQPEFFYLLHSCWNWHFWQIQTMGQPFLPLPPPHVHYLLLFHHYCRNPLSVKQNGFYKEKVQI